MIALLLPTHIRLFGQFHLFHKRNIVQNLLVVLDIVPIERLEARVVGIAAVGLYYCDSLEDWPCEQRIHLWVLPTILRHWTMVMAPRMSVVIQFVVGLHSERKEYHWETLEATQHKVLMKDGLSTWCLDAALVIVCCRFCDVDELGSDELAGYLV